MKNSTNKISLGLAGFLFFLFVFPVLFVYFFAFLKTPAMGLEGVGFILFDLIITTPLAFLIVWRVIENLKKDELAHPLIDKEFDIIWGFFVWLVGSIFVFRPLLKVMEVDYSVKSFLPITLILSFWITISWRRSRRSKKFLSVNN